jgi:hypothetical protein
MMWAQDNIKDYPYLLINPITDLEGREMVGGPVAYTKPPAIPPAMAALLQITEEDMTDLLGNQQGGEQIASNVAEGTVELIQNRLDMQTYIYMSNAAKARKRGAEIWLSMAQDLFVEENRKMKIVGKEGEAEQITLMQPTIMDDGEQGYANDLTKARFNITTTVGPSSSTRRASTVRALVGMKASTTDPETIAVLDSMIMMNMEGEGISDARKYFRRKLIRMGVIEPTEKEREELAQEMAAMPPDAQEEYLKAAAENERAQAAESQADTIYTQARADKTRAETIETMVDIDSKQREQAAQAIQEFRPRVAPPSVMGSPVQE